MIDLTQCVVFDAFFCIEGNRLVWLNHNTQQGTWALNASQVYWIIFVQRYTGWRVDVYFLSVDVSLISISLADCFNSLASVTTDVECCVFTYIATKSNSVIFVNHFPRLGSQSPFCPSECSGIREISCVNYFQQSGKNV